MNKRIKELVKQAGGISCDDDNNELTPMLVGKELEKFAKLIIMECVKVAEDTDTGLDQVSTYIKEHFGVKE